MEKLFIVIILIIVLFLFIFFNYCLSYRFFRKMLFEQEKIYFIPCCICFMFVGVSLGFVLDLINILTSFMLN